MPTEVQQSAAQKTCPLMSGASPVVSESTGIALVGQGGKAIATATPSQQVDIVTFFVPCIETKCAWWDQDKGGCKFLKQFEGIGQLRNNLAVIGEAISARLGVITGHLAHLEPPASGKSPMMRLAEAVECLVEQNKKRRDT